MKLYRSVSVILAAALSTTLPWAHASRTEIESPGGEELCSKAGSREVCNDRAKNCAIRSIRQNKEVLWWCQPRCDESSVQRMDLCESPWCTWSSGRCRHFDDASFLTVPEKDVTLPGPRMMDSIPAGIKIPEIPCGPGVGEVTRNFIQQRYSRDWGRFWSATVRKGVYLNGHLMALNGCDKCKVFDTKDRSYQERDFVNTRDWNELVVSCVSNRCRSPSFFVDQSLTRFWNYCHPCPPECLECNYRRFQNTFKCILNEGTHSIPSGYTCNAASARKKGPGWSTHCQLRPFYVRAGGTDKHQEDMIIPKAVAKHLDSLELPAGWGGREKVTVVPGQDLVVQRP